MTMQYKTTKKFYKKNPYELDSRAWHIYLDIQSVTGNKPMLIDIDKMLKVQGTDWKYYDLDIGILVEDKLLEIIYNLKKEVKDV
jgi:hypothetical protein